MRLTVADLDAEDHLSSSSIPRLPGFDDDTASILYIPLPASRPGRALDGEIVELPSWARRNRLTVIAVHPWRRADVDDSVLDDIASRVPDAPLYLLDHDDVGRPRLAVARGSAILDLDHDSLLRELRTADVRAVIMSQGAHLPAANGLHYVGPNGSHYAAFLRPGFALTASERLDRISFWLLEHVRGRSTIVVDHWSLRSLAHHAIAYAARVFAPVAGPFIESLRGYRETEQSLGPRLRQAFPASTDGEALLLLSINSSGALAHDVVLPALRAAGQAGAGVVALASASREEDRRVRALLQLDETFDSYPADVCPHCAGASRPLPIDAGSYMLRLAAFTDETAITKDDARASTEVIQRYAGIGAFDLHRDHNDAARERHHAFYVDVNPMLDTKEFKRRLLGAVGRLEGIEPTVIICPPSAAAVRLAQMVASHLDVDHLVVSDEQGLHRVSADQLHRLQTATDVLLVDDVVITGTRIEGFRQELITLRRAAGLSGEVKLGCLVGVARARDARALQGCMDFVHHTEAAKTFAAVETLHLPNWDERTCPWCRELRALVDLPEEVQTLRPIARRIEQLVATDGLAEPFFASGATEPEPSAATDQDDWAVLDDAGGTEFADRYWDLNPGSVFGRVQGRDLVVSVAAAVHALRSKVDHRGRLREPRLDRAFRTPVSKVLDPSLYVFGRFYEPVLLASILRVCNEWDVRSPAIDDELAEGVEAHLGYLASGQRFLPEAVVLAHLGRLPRRAVRSLPEPGTDVAALAEALLRA